MSRGGYRRKPKISFSLALLLLLALPFFLSGYLWVTPNLAGGDQQVLLVGLIFAAIAGLLLWEW